MKFIIEMNDNRSMNVTLSNKDGTVGQTTKNVDLWEVLKMFLKTFYADLPTEPKK